MTYDDAVKYCEEHECVECEVYLKDLDKRTKHEKENLHYPCCVNLVDNDNKFSVEELQATIDDKLTINHQREISSNIFAKQFISD